MVLAGPADVGVLGPEHFLGELEHPGEVRFRQAQDRQDHLERVVDGDVVGEVAAAAHGRHAIDVVRSQLVDPVRHLSDVARLEPVVDDPPVALCSSPSIWTRVFMPESPPPPASRSAVVANAGTGPLVKISALRSISMTSACLVIAQKSG